VSGTVAASTNGGTQIGSGVRIAAVIAARIGSGVRTVGAKHANGMDDSVVMAIL